MKQYSNLIKLVIPMILSAPAVKAATLSEVWFQIKANSPAQEASKLQEQSLQESVDRSSKHWLPKVYLDVKAYRSNDPSHSFVGLLEQRKVEQADFAPNLLNHPDSSTYTRGAIGFDLPLYEGGMKKNQVELYQHTLTAQKSNTQQVEIEQYSQVSQAYGSIAVLKNQIDKLNGISNEIQKLLKSYQIGQKSNPVGYSGLLGMKSLSNRLTGLIEQFKSQQIVYYKMLNVMGFSNENWTPEFDSTVKYIDKNMSSPAAEDGSYKTDSFAQNAEAAFSVADMEQARFLPKVGAFAETYAFKGERDTANGYNAGLYLQWSLFDPADLGRVKEAKIKAQSYKKQVHALLQQEAAEKNGTIVSDQALRANLKLLDDSDKLLNEQMQVAGTLFRNGSITALQLVEILNRRTDLVVQQVEIETNLLKTAAQKIIKTKFDIPVQQNSGGR